MKYIITLLALLILGTASVIPQSALAQDNPSDSGYKLTVCDGPAGAIGAGQTACDFQGLVLLVQHLINAALIFGVFVAIGGFLWIGYLLISGTQDNRKRAKEIFPKIFWGFIIMLSAWFIVYEILSWMSANPAFKALLH